MATRKVGRFPSLDAGGSKSPGAGGLGGFCQDGSGDVVGIRSVGEVSGFLLVVPGWLLSGWGCVGDCSGMFPRLFLDASGLGLVEFGIVLEWSFDGRLAAPWRGRRRRLRRRLQFLRFVISRNSGNLELKKNLFRRGKLLRQHHLWHSG